MSYNRKLVFAAACLGMLVFGITLTTLGAVLPSLVERFAIDKAEAGSLFLLMSLGLLAGSLVFGPIVDRYGYKGMLLAASALILLGLQAIAFAPSFGWLRVAMPLIGFGGGVINGGTNALAADVSEEGRSAGLSLLGVFFGIGAVGVPFSLGFLLDAFSYSALVAALGVPVLIEILYIAAIAFPRPKQAQGFPLARAARLVGDGTLLLLGLLLFLQSGMEITVGGWTATFFHEEMGLAGNRALFVLSLFWFGMMLARLVLGGLLKTVSPAAVLLGCIALAALGAGLLLMAATLVPAAAGVFLIGAGLAAGFPVVLGYVGDRYSALSGTAFSIVLAMALTGGSVLPYLTGVVGEAQGLRASLLVVPAALVLQALLFAVVLRRLAAVRTAAPSPASAGGTGPGR